MHDALATLRSERKRTNSAWTGRILDAIDRYLDARPAAIDPSHLAGVLAQAVRWPGCPRALDLSDDRATPYRRIPLSDVRNCDYEALLILWPPGHATPIHDHAGLWGIELALDGTLEVESFALSFRGALRLDSHGKSILGIGNHASFAEADHAHRCRNLSSARPALSLHVYGGGLDTYRSYHQQRPGEWIDAIRQARREPALI